MGWFNSSDPTGPRRKRNPGQDSAGAQPALRERNPFVLLTENHSRREGFMSNTGGADFPAFFAGTSAAPIQTGAYIPTNGVGTYAPPPVVTLASHA